MNRDGTKLCSKVFRIFIRCRLYEVPGSSHLQDNPLDWLISGEVTQTTKTEVTNETSPYYKLLDDYASTIQTESRSPSYPASSPSKVLQLPIHLEAIFIYFPYSRLYFL